MSEMVGVAGPAGPVGNGRVSNGPRAPPVPASANPRAPSGVRTPTEIMRSRRDREARQKAEQEAREREQEELERQQVEQEQLALAQAQAQQYAAGAAGASSDPAQRRARTQRAPRGPETQLEPLNTAIPASASVRPPPAAAQPYQVPSDIPNQPLPNPSLSQQKIPSTTPLVQAQSAPAPGGPSGATGIPKQPQPPQPAQPDTSLQQPRRATFPHAFERWETLSSHWEGLTSYWIRKLEQNNDDLEKDPLSQQLARQITDLSAAGANLFHAVVELQRLRASSERKFQRWFFDTRSEQERAKELQADLERQVQTERQGRTEALATSQAAEKDKNRSEELLREMRRELQISKDEARRAWEELGRREQEERERTNSLRNGEPTLVGGVQVVPMIQGLPNRNTRPPTREGPYPGGPTTTSMGTEYQGKGPDPNASRTYYDEGTAMSPTGSDPFIEEQQAQARSDVPTSNPPYSTAVYEPGTTATSYPAHTAEQDDLHSYVGSSEAGDDEYPGFHPDASSQGYGYAAPPRSEGSDEYTHSPVDDRHYTSEGAYTGATTAPVQAPYPPTTADYSGSDWGPEWGSITPRHRHPTRLSDVLEEDEPSRTSPSRASQASRSIL